MQSLTQHAEFLRATEVIDWGHPEVYTLAMRLSGGEKDDASTARQCFEWVRDEIQHCMDFGRTEVTCKASEVLAHRTGFCYAKSHLLAALLRANGIPAGFCYQRLSIDGFGPPFSLHGFNAVQLTDFGWYRVDSRGNKAGVDAQFTPPIEKLAFPLHFSEEFDVAGIFADPLPQVIEALRRYDRADLLAANLPDLVEPVHGGKSTSPTSAATVKRN